MNMNLLSHVFSSYLGLLSSFCRFTKTHILLSSNLLQEVFAFVRLPRNSYLSHNASSSRLHHPTVELNKATVDHERTVEVERLFFGRLIFIWELASFPMELQYCRELESDKRSMILADKLLFIKMCLYLCLNKESDGSEVTVCVFLDHTVITKPLTKTENIHFEKDTLSKWCLVLKNVMQTGYVCVCVCGRVYWVQMLPKCTKECIEALVHPCTIIYIYS